MMYEVHPDDESRWILYKVGGGDHLVIAWFTQHDDALFARDAFERRDAEPTPLPRGR